MEEKDIQIRIIFKGGIITFLKIKEHELRRILGALISAHEKQKRMFVTSKNFAINIDDVLCVNEIVQPPHLETD